MSRYNKIQTLKEDGGRRYLKTVQYPTIPRSARDLYILGREGDRLDNMANKWIKTKKKIEEENYEDRPSVTGMFQDTGPLGANIGQYGTHIKGCNCPPGGSTVN